MKTTNELIIEQQRSIILQRLANSPGYSSNEFMLQAELLNQGLGLGLTELKVQINWLVEHDLCSVEPLIITLKQDGLDAAKNLITIDGVATPNICETCNLI